MAIQVLGLRIDKTISGIIVITIVTNHVVVRSYVTNNSHVHFKHINQWTQYKMIN